MEDVQKMLNVEAAAAVKIRCIFRMHIAVGVKISACVTSWVNMSSSIDSMQKKKKNRKWSEVTTPRRSKVMVIPQKK